MFPSAVAIRRPSTWRPAPNPSPRQRDAKGSHSAAPSVCSGSDDPAVDLSGQAVDALGEPGVHPRHHHTDGPIRKRGVPKKRANVSARRPKESGPNAPWSTVRSWGRCWGPTSQLLFGTKSGRWRHSAWDQAARIRMGPVARDGSMGRPRWVISTSPAAARRRAARRVGSMRGRQSSPPTLRAASDGQIEPLVEPTSRRISASRRRSTGPGR